MRFLGHDSLPAGGTTTQRTILDLPETTCRKDLDTEYRQYLYLQGAAGTENNPPAFDLATAQEVVDQEDGQLSLQERLRRRIRHRF